MPGDWTIGMRWKVSNPRWPFTCAGAKDPSDAGLHRTGTAHVGGANCRRATADEPAACCTEKQGLFVFPALHASLLCVLPVGVLFTVSYPDGYDPGRVWGATF